MVKKNIFITVLSLLAFAGYSQKVQFKKNQVLVDEQVWLKYDDCGTFDSTCSLRNLEGEEIIFLKMINIEGAAPRTSSNPKGNFTYWEVSFLGLKKKIELEDISQKGIVKYIYNGKVVNADGTLNPDNVDKLVEKYGADISPRFKNY